MELCLGLLASRDPGIMFGDDENIKLLALLCFFFVEAESLLSPCSAVEEERVRRRDNVIILAFFGCCTGHGGTIFLDYRPQGVHSSWMQDGGYGESNKTGEGRTAL